MMSEAFLNGRVALWPGDMREVLKGFDADSIDSCVCDPPYHLTSIVKRWSGDGPPPVEGVYRRSTAGFMGKRWDGGDVAFRPETWAAVYRVLKPGAHLIAFSCTRTYHRMVCAIEDAGFEVRDQIGWAYGSGFPKSHNVANSIDKMHGAGDRGHRIARASAYHPDGTKEPSGDHLPPYEARTEHGLGWEGWGTALKPAWEPIVLARKPLVGTVAENVLRHGTGALNIDGCRIQKAADDRHEYGVSGDEPSMAGGGVALGNMNRVAYEPHSSGRWPANLIHDGSDEVLAAFPETNGQGGGVRGDEPSQCHSGVYSGPRNRLPFPNRGDTGSAARFFYSAKADADDRLGSKHPTVKPLDLMQYLVRLVTPPRGTVLDPFAGTGTTGEAAWREGFSAILIEAEPEYQADIRKRMSLADAGPDERRARSVKQEDPDALPLFGAGA